MQRAMFDQLAPRARRGLLALLVICVLGACQSGGYVKMHEPLNARPRIQPAVAAPTDGAIFPGGGMFRPMFEDRRPRQMGDILIVQINEKLSASQQSKSTADRTSKAAVEVPLINRLPFKTVQGLGVQGSGEQAFEGKGETSNNNVFTGTISVTVVEVLPNGNLLVAGDKQIGINHNAEMLRFSGIINPATLQSGNSINSSQVAEARLEYIGRGYIDEAQSMPWLQRIFMNILPF